MSMPRTTRFLRHVFEGTLAACLILGTLQLYHIVTPWITDAYKPLTNEVRSVYLQKMFVRNQSRSTFSPSLHIYTVNDEEEAIDPVEKVISKVEGDIDEDEKGALLKEALEEKRIFDVYGQYLWRAEGVKSDDLREALRNFVQITTRPFVDSEDPTCRALKVSFPNLTDSQKEQCLQTTCPGNYCTISMCNEFPVNENCSVSTCNVFPTIGLASIAQSGNTWLRFLIEAVTGFFTGSVFRDGTLAFKGFYGEAMSFNSGLCILIKTHGETIERIEQVNKTAILLMRNPYKNIISRRHSIYGGHQMEPTQDENAFVGKDWNINAEYYAWNWKQFHLAWLREPETNLHVVHYENLLDNLEFEIRTILAFLGFHNVQEKRLQCALQHSEGRAHRRQLALKSTNPTAKGYLFNNPRLGAIVDEAIDSVDRALKERGFAKGLPLEKYKFTQELHVTRSL